MAFWYFRPFRFEPPQVGAKLTGKDWTGHVEVRSIDRRGLHVAHVIPQGPNEGTETFLVTHPLRLPFSRTAKVWVIPTEERLRPESRASQEVVRATTMMLPGDLRICKVQQIPRRNGSITVHYEMQK